VISEILRVSTKHLALGILHLATGVPGGIPAEVMLASTQS